MNSFILYTILNPSSAFRRQCLVLQMCFEGCKNSEFKIQEHQNQIDEEKCLSRTIIDV